MNEPPLSCSKSGVCKMDTKKARPDMGRALLAVPPKLCMQPSLARFIGRTRWIHHPVAPEWNSDVRLRPCTHRPLSERRGHPVSPSTRDCVIAVMMFNFIISSDRAPSRDSCALNLTYREIFIPVDTTFRARAPDRRAPCPVRAARKEAGRQPASGDKSVEDSVCFRHFSTLFHTFPQKNCGKVHISPKPVITPTTDGTC